MFLRLRLSKVTKSSTLSYLLISLSIFLIYSNNLECSWQLDDMQNIVLNKDIQITSLSATNILAPVDHSLSSTALPVSGRAFSFFTLALNWYFGKDTVTGYHLFNNCIHILTALFLYKLIFEILTIRPKFSFSEGRARSIALLSTLLWAVNPLHTQAVTYIIQRMTLLSALFSCIALLLFVIARKNKENCNRILIFGLCSIVSLLAFFSKENAILLPGSFLLFEIIFFTELSYKQFFTYRFIKNASLFLIFVIMLCYLGLNILGIQFSHLLNGYETRYFTLSERLLTEPRVLLYYLSLFFYPIASRLSIEHDFTLSHSLFTPISTGVALLIIILSVWRALFFRNKRPLFSLGVLFFFYNHILESSFLPLELVFEHRNYLPTFFLFLPIATIVFCLPERLYKFQPLLLVCLTFFLIISAVGTYSRNFSWRTPLTLYQDAINKGSTKARTYNNLAINNFLINRDKEYSLRLLNIAKSKIEERDKDIIYKTLDNELFILKATQSTRSEIINQYEALTRHRLGTILSYLKFIPELLQYRMYERAEIELRKLEKLIKEYNVETVRPEIYLKYLNLSTKSKLFLNNTHDAKPFLFTTLEFGLNHFESVVNLAIYHYKNKNFEAAYHYFEEADKMNPLNIECNILLVQCSYYLGNEEQFNHHLDDLFSRFSFKKLTEELSSSNPLYETQLVKQFLFKKFSSSGK